MRTSTGRRVGTAHHLIKIYDCGALSEHGCALRTLRGVQCRLNVRACSESLSLSGSYSQRVRWPRGSLLPVYSGPDIEVAHDLLGLVFNAVAILVLKPEQLAAAVAHLEGRVAQRVLVHGAVAVVVVRQRLLFGSVRTVVRPC